MKLMLTRQQMKDVMSKVYGKSTRLGKSMREQIDYYYEHKVDKVYNLVPVYGPNGEDYSFSYTYNKECNKFEVKR